LVLPGGFIADVYVNGVQGSPFELIVTPGDAPSNGTQGNVVVTPVVSVIMIDPNTGMELQPSESVTICITAPSLKARSLCLGSYDEKKRRWSCDDICLKQKNGTLCGTVDHLTNFAILLAGQDKNRDSKSDPCASESDQRSILYYLSAAFISFAILIVLISLVVIELYIRGNRKRKMEEAQNVVVLSDNCYPSHRFV
jgi:hypothetical protein